jgi:hypothetical protein
MTAPVADVRTLVLTVELPNKIPEKVLEIPYPQAGDLPRIVHHDRQVYRWEGPGTVNLYSLEPAWSTTAGTYEPGLLDLDELIAAGEAGEVAAALRVAGQVRAVLSSAETMAAARAAYSDRMNPEVVALTDAEGEAIERILDAVRVALERRLMRGTEASR